MLKFYFQNTSQTTDATIRIFKLTNKEDIQAKDDFTRMDELGGSYGIFLAKSAGIQCIGGTGTLTYTREFYAPVTVNIDEAKIQLTLTVGGKPAHVFTYDPMMYYLSEALQQPEYTDDASWLNENGIVITGEDNVVITNTGSSGLSYEFKLIEVNGSSDLGEVTLHSMFKDFVTGSGNFENDVTYHACIAAPV